ncbi:MAG: SDR family NAD(P)-dependent oxidoreductase [Acidimicrobiales bacterium]
MSDTFEGKVAVITGAASGIGFGLAEHAAGIGMRLVMADVEEVALRDSAERLRGTGAEVRHVVTDVSSEASVMSLAATTNEYFGPVSLLCNNAGVNSPGPTWELTRADWEWVLGVNLWGVIHGIRAFVPDMVARNEGYVVNTSSMGGLLISPQIAPYSASKHGVIAISETMWRELADAGSNVGVSVVCPGYVSTRLLDSKRNWLDRFGAPLKPLPERVPATDAPPAAQKLDGMAPSEAARIIFDAVAARQFWILTHPEQYASAVRERFDGVIEAHDPTRFKFA